MHIMAKIPAGRSTALSTVKRRSAAFNSSAVLPPCFRTFDLVFASNGAVYRHIHPSHSHPHPNGSAISLVLNPPSLPFAHSSAPFATTIPQQPLYACSCFLNSPFIEAQSKRLVESVQAFKWKVGPGLKSPTNTFLERMFPAMFRQAYHFCVRSEGLGELSAKKDSAELFIDQFVPYAAAWDRLAHLQAFDLVARSPTK